MSKSKSFFETAKQKIKDQVSEFFDQNKDEIKTKAKKIVDDGIKSFQDAAINKADNFMNSKNNTKDITSSSSNNHVQKNKEQVEVSIN